jgi:hypothetical protein
LKSRNFPDNRLTDGSESVRLTCRPPFFPQKYFMILISVRVCVNPPAGRLCQLKEKFNDLIGNRNHGPSCSQHNCLNQLRYCVPPLLRKRISITMDTAIPTEVCTPLLPTSVPIYNYLYYQRQHTCRTYETTSDSKRTVLSSSVQFM